MKKFFCFVICLSLVTGIVLADNSDRISELKAEAQKLLQNKQQMVQTIQRIDARLIGIGAILQELEAQDLKVEEGKNADTVN